MLLCASVMLSFAVISSSATSIEAYPSDTYKACSSDGEAETTRELVPPRRESFRSTMPNWGSSEGLGQFLTIHDGDSMKNGSIANFSEMKLPIHTGTHVDAPGHVFDAVSFHICLINYRSKNVWILQSRRTKLLFHNAYDDMIPSHLVFLEGRVRKLFIGLLNTFKLDDVKEGMYNVHCLPLRLFGAEGSPIRCILIRWLSLMFLCKFLVLFSRLCTSIVVTGIDIVV
ncbi:hypothetical protein MKX03_026260 [Papaver bracteatum]|nr:hypothetical protein MKX03_026260 [Papaver bracteatum]